MIRFIKEFVVSNVDGHIIRVFGTGEKIRAARDTGTHYVTGLGNIYYDEAERAYDTDV